MLLVEYSPSIYTTILLFATNHRPCILVLHFPPPPPPPPGILPPTYTVAYPDMVLRVPLALEKHNILYN